MNEELHPNTTSTCPSSDRHGSAERQCATADLKLEEGSDGTLHIGVRKGRVLDESAQCEHLDLPISKMDVDPAKKPHEAPNMDP